MELAEGQEVAVEHLPLNVIRASANQKYLFSKNLCYGFIS